MRKKKRPLLTTLLFMGVFVFLSGMTLFNTDMGMAMLIEEDEYRRAFYAKLTACAADINIDPQGIVQGGSPPLESPFCGFLGGQLNSFNRAWERDIHDSKKLHARTNRMSRKTEAERNAGVKRGQLSRETYAAIDSDVDKAINELEKLRKKTELCFQILHPGISYFLPVSCRGVLGLSSISYDSAIGQQIVDAGYSERDFVLKSLDTFNKQ